MKGTIPENRLNLYDLTRTEVKAWFADWNLSSFYADRLWAYLYRERVTSLAAMPELREEIRVELGHRTSMPVPEIAAKIRSSDGFTRKYLLRLTDGQTIETVLMYFSGRDGRSRATACVSTQVGCAMGCVFCATGQMGFARHLTPGEIVTQVLHVQRVLAEQGERLRNVVFMGMGEPLHNYDHTMTAVEILMDHKGLAIAPKHITLSTVGVVPGIRRLADEARPFRLAVSLHGATDAERQALVPPAKRWPLADLMEACRYYVATRKRRIFFEWALIAGENDGPEQAHALGRLLHGIDAHVNLIPLNPTEGYAGAPTEETVVADFQAVLAGYDLPSTVRQRRGIDVAAGCGQLKSQAPTIFPFL